jgi:hypothetical protein
VAVELEEAGERSVMVRTLPDVTYLLLVPTV